ncbi:CLUMA_CG000118, isoform A [Clunio marinus]|uniref:CLUMA_CG000118, isoform A n=1 Tax=Clunio marinus TaxID=568069 RepID=A0A1J1HJ39_9DIPT|nr:CLUMA_CG000118, isoform A [Clunio marinus]
MRRIYISGNKLFHNQIIAEKLFHARKLRIYLKFLPL